MPGVILMLRKSLLINPKDNVRVLLEDAFKGDEVETDAGTLTLFEDVEFAHKVLIRDLKANDPVLKYGEEIGRIVADTPKGAWVHNHNMSCLRGTR